MTDRIEKRSKALKILTDAGVKIGIGNFLPYQTFQLLPDGQVYITTFCTAEQAARIHAILNEVDDGKDKV